jgi:hypothetical protein
VFEANDLCSLHAQLAAEAVRVELSEAAPGLRPLATFHCSLLTLLFPAPAPDAAPTLLRMQPARHFPVRNLFTRDVNFSLIYFTLL